MAQTLTFACIYSLTSPGDTARRHMSREGRSILYSMTSKPTAHTHTHIDISYRHSVRSFLFIVSIFFPHRFEFDVSLEEAKTRKLDVAVKNNKMFHTRERKDIGMVGSAICTELCFYS